MSYAHKQNDQRNCGATTIVTGQNFVTIDGKLWAVEGDQDSHGGGALIATKTFVKINNKKVIVDGDNASPDNARHTNPKAVSPSGFVEVE
jgi:uncharacterized Zn-binding protein involved in type VI secretion